VGGLITGILVGAFTSDRLTRDQLPSDVPLILASATVLGLSYGSLILR
jgi:uncharacterized protein YneF (UPF0154 family)